MGDESKAELKTQNPSSLAMPFIHEHGEWEGMIA
jgi:hypothetical protein